MPKTYSSLKLNSKPTVMGFFDFLVPVSLRIRIAAVKGNAGLVAQLLEEGVDINTLYRGRETLLSLAYANSRLEVVTLLLKRNAAIDEKLGRAMLLKEAESGNIQMLALLLDKGLDVNTRNQSGTSPLLLAANQGHDKTTKFLLDKGADVNTADANGVTSLLAAASGGHFTVVKILVENGASMELQDNQGTTALEAASAKGHNRIFEYLQVKTGLR